MRYEQHNEQRRWWLKYDNRTSSAWFQIKYTKQKVLLKNSNPKCLPILTFSFVEIIKRKVKKKYSYFQKTKRKDTHQLWAGYEGIFLYKRKPYFQQSIYCFESLWNKKNVKREQRGFVERWESKVKRFQSGRAKTMVDRDGLEVE